MFAAGRGTGRLPRPGPRHSTAPTEPGASSAGSCPCAGVCLLRNSTVSQAASLLLRVLTSLRAPRADEMSSRPHWKDPQCTRFTKSLVLSPPPHLPAAQPVLCAVSSPSQSAQRGLHLPWERGTKSAEGDVQGEVMSVFIVEPSCAEAPGGGKAGKEVDELR